MYLTHFLVVLAVFGLILMGKPVQITGRGLWCMGMGWPCIPQGYLCYSLRSIIMGVTADLFQIVTETRILNPQLAVTKCSQLDLILVHFKSYDPNHFQFNLQVSPNTFDSLLEMIEMHPVFLNASGCQD